MARRILRTAVPILLGLAVVPSQVRAQQAPPPPLPLQEVEFPEFRELTLSNGARAVVVTNTEIPLVTVNLVIPGGSAADPVGKEGAASMVAQLLTQGTSTRGHEEMAEAVDFLGATLGAGAGRDEISVTLGSLTGQLDEALALMADAVLDPTFPEDRLELLRTQNLSALQVALSQAATVASRAFIRSVYGDHPYGKLETPASLRALTRDDLAAFHREHFTPSSALFVVAGDITADEAVARLEGAFREWTGGSGATEAHPTVLDRAAPEVILVHKPGSVQAEVRVGHLLAEGDHPDWTSLAVANQVLGGTSASRLFQVLREEMGYTYGAYSSLGRARGQGTFQASMAVRNE
ncbi:MAG TPA: pitrilysin family protein, partial [Longimicrobiales bacterium]|nr:pitrilysin family protein [Longimicrobiales bacterium]